MSSPIKVDLRGCSQEALAGGFIESDALANALFTLSWEEVLMIANQIYIFTKNQKLALQKEFEFFKDRTYGRVIENAVPISGIQALLLTINQQGDNDANI